MTGPEWIQWGRAKRGYAWHVLTPWGAADGRRDAALCSLDHDIVNATQGQPPRGAKVCSACERRVIELSRAVLAALEQEPSISGDPAATNDRAEPTTITQGAA